MNKRNDNDMYYDETHLHYTHVRSFYYYLFLYLPVDCVYQNEPSARIRNSDSVQS